MVGTVVGEPEFVNDGEIVGERDGADDEGEIDGAEVAGELLGADVVGDKVGDNEPACGEPVGTPLGLRLEAVEVGDGLTTLGDGGQSPSYSKS